MLNKTCKEKNTTLLLFGHKLAKIETPLLAYDAWQDKQNSRGKRKTRPKTRHQFKGQSLKIQKKTKTKGTRPTLVKQKRWNTEKEEIDE